MKFSRISIAAVIVLLFQASFVALPLRAQQHWQQVVVPAGLHIFSPYFVNRDYGFIYTPGITGALGPMQGWGNALLSAGQPDQPAVYRTLDGGKTWKSMNIGEIASSSYAVILQICFDSASHGYLVAYDTDYASGSKGGLFETTDSGADWNRISPDGMAFQSLCISDSFVFLVKNDGLGQSPSTLVIYNKNAQAFRELNGPLGVSIVSNKGSIIYSHHEYVTMRSISEGKAWTSAERGDSTQESWSLYAIKNTQTIIRAAESVQTGGANSTVPDYSNIQISTDGGASWSNSYVSLPYSPDFFMPVIGDVDGDGCTVYVGQTLEAPDSGLLRSTDIGKTWQKIGGPIHTCDSRTLSVVEKGAVVYATEDEGDIFFEDPDTALWTRLWKTTDGGDGFFNRVDPPIITVGTVPDVSACEHSRTSVKISYNSCFVNLSIDTIAIAGDTEHFSLDSLPAFPTVFSGQSGTSFNVKFNPRLHPGNYIDSIRIHASVPGQTATLDTLIQITAIATPIPPQLISADSSINFGALTKCTGIVGRDTSVLFTNIGCGPDTITSLTLAGAGFSGANDSLPIIVQPGDSVTLEYHFVPPAPGSYSGTVKLNVTSMGLIEERIIRLSGVGLPAPASLSISDTALSFGTFSRCNAIADTTITLTNSGCDSLSLSGASVDAGSGFTLVSGADTVLAPNQSMVYKIHFSDSVTGGFASALHVHAVGAHGGNVFDTSISLNVSIVPGSHLAALSTRAIDFGITSICEERDSTITISNFGCETDTIFQGNLLSSQFLLDTSFPIIIRPGEAAIIPVLTKLDTSGHPVDVVDTLDFVSNMDSALPPIALSRGVTYPGRFSLGLKTEDSAAIRATVPVYVLRKGTIPAAADELDFDLIYNDDLLGYSNVIEPNIQPGNATLLPSGLTDRSFAMKPAADRDTIATLLFKSYLAKQQHTPISLANQKFMSGGATSPPCVASIDSATDTGFTLELVCGDGALINALTGLPLDVVSMNVSPDALDFTLACGDASLASCSAEVLNVLGAQALQKRFDLSRVTTASFDLHALPAGAYFLRIAAGRSVITKRFVIVK